MNDLVTLLPELVLAVLVLTIITVDLFLPRSAKWVLTPMTVIGLLIAGAACFVVWGTNREVYSGLYRVDDLSVFLKAATVVTGVFSTLFAPGYLSVRRIPLGEFNTVLVTALIGMCVLASSSDLITLFLGLELMTMPSYILAGLHKTDRYSNEGGLKYFLLGSFASAIVLFGISWTFGLTGTTNIGEIASAVGGGPMNAGLLVAIGFLTVGGAFKIAAVPFHYWTPDAYQGAPTPITGFLSVGPKIGAFALLIRVFAEALAPLRTDWLGVFLVLTVLTMTVGNVIALTQVNVKRMLAYSSIAHTGYIMAGLAAFANADDQRVAQQGIQSVLFYLLGYAFMNIAAFAVVAMLQRDTTRFGGLNSFSGLAARAPARAAAMGILMLSLTGIPPTVGFFAKLYILLASVEANLEWLAVIIVLNAALAAFYYLRVIVYMYMRDPED
ncbi:MAG: NADH-quinone oxidoreductase subunit N, partial [Candidatus Limnocylindria bacterium]